MIQTNRWRPLPWILDPWWLGRENSSQQPRLKLILKECGNQGNLLQVRIHYFWADLFMISKGRRCQESLLTYAPDSPAVRKVSWQMFVCDVSIQPDAALLMSINTGTLYPAEPGESQPEESSQCQAPLRHHHCNRNRAKLNESAWSRCKTMWEIKSIIQNNFSLPCCPHPLIMMTVILDLSLHCLFYIYFLKTQQSKRTTTTTNPNKNNWKNLSPPPIPKLFYRNT